MKSRPSSGPWGEGLSMGREAEEDVLGLLGIAAVSHPSSVNLHKRSFTTRMPMRISSAMLLHSYA